MNIVHRRLKILSFLILVPAALLSGCQSHNATIIDLTHAFDDRTIYWPTNQSFEWQKTDWGITERGYWYASANFSASEHGGTHMDAPIHFAQSRQTLDEIPPDHLVGPAVVIDLRERCKTDRDYTLAVEDIRAWEDVHGQIRPGDLVFVWTGWSAYWPDKEQYLGSQTPGDSSSLHFPGFSQEAAAFLVHQRNIRGVGIDTASIDAGQSRQFLAHRTFSEANVYALENVAQLDRLPPRGADVIALPMKIRGGTGGPVRIIAILN